jgi:hypothetical protein
LVAPEVAQLVANSNNRKKRVRFFIIFNVLIVFILCSLFAAHSTIRLIRYKFVIIRIYNNLLLRFFIRCHFLQNNPSNVFLQIFSSTFTVIYPLSYKKAKSGMGAILINT